MNAPQRNDCAPYAEWLARRDDLERAVKLASKAWRAVPGNGSGAMGLTPDSVKQSPEWQGARRAYQRAADDLARHVAPGVKRFKRQLAADREAARAAMLAQMEGAAA